MNLKSYLEQYEFSTKEILDALSDGEFLGRFDVTQDEVEELYDYYLNKSKEV